jgi:rsbT co-antagonist protein RsbR
MAPNVKSRIPEILAKHEPEILADWIKEQQTLSSGGNRIGDADLKSQCTQFLRLFRDATKHDNLTGLQAPEWGEVRAMLTEISSSRARQGFTPSETAAFVFSLKRPLVERLGHEVKQDSASMMREVWTATQLLDSLGLMTTEAYQKTREEVINRQQEDMLELSTPVVKLWDGVLALPLIGTLDSARTQVVMENLLQTIVATGSSVAILDITGVPTVDTLVAQHLLKTVTAARLMGADCIISGIRPQTAQTIVHLGVDLSGVITKASLADAFALALQRIGVKLVRNEARA